MISEYSWSTACFSSFVCGLIGEKPEYCAPTIVGWELETSSALKTSWSQPDSPEGLTPNTLQAPQTPSLRLSDLFAHTLQKGRNFWWRGWRLRWRWRLPRRGFLPFLLHFLTLSCSALSASPLPRMTRRQSNYKQESKQRNSFYRSLGFIAVGKCVYLV